MNILKKCVDRNVRPYSLLPLKRNVICGKRLSRIFQETFFRIHKRTFFRKSAFRILQGTLLWILPEVPSGILADLAGIPQEVYSGIFPDVINEKMKNLQGLLGNSPRSICSFYGEFLEEFL